MFGDVNERNDGEMKEKKEEKERQNEKKIKCFNNKEDEKKIKDNEIKIRLKECHPMFSMKQTVASGC